MFYVLDKYVQVVFWFSVGGNDSLCGLQSWFPCDSKNEPNVCRVGFTANGVMEAISILFSSAKVVKTIVKPQVSRAFIGENPVSLSFGRFLYFLPR